jgi:hypothetical protein
MAIGFLINLYAIYKIPEVEAGASSDDSKNVRRDINYWPLLQPSLTVNAVRQCVVRASEEGDTKETGLVSS